MIIQVTDLKQAGPDIFSNLTDLDLRTAYENQGGFFFSLSLNVF